MSEEYNLKKELDKRNISIDDLRFFEAYGLANFIIETKKTVDDIAEWLVDKNRNIFSVNDSKFIKATEDCWNQMKDIEYWYTKHLDELQEIIYEEDKPTIDASKLKLWIEEIKKTSQVDYWLFKEVKNE